ncbi:hypothetical protein [Endozoicomonas sp. 8E]|uniref:hypothetical protein n=1 Tax=Endozoicomonas sp. 8E TaxID=3035692 RepID=UPI0029390B27|nr:hypothetical protein [Endozoicomonas sp. 8E]WOG29042.1 hypothetical protein P6910_05095 [Endozoicomonas sp. 8E]
MYENIWLTDNETYYENCEIPEDHPTTEKDFFICNDPTRLVFLNLLFLEHSAGRNDRTFKDGKHYYLLSTSTGAESSINNRKGGHCLTHNMRLKIYVCKKKLINETNPECRGSTDPQPNFYSPTEAFVYAPFKDPLTNPLTNPVTTTLPVITNDTDSDIDDETETVVTKTTDTAPVIMTDTETVIAKATTTTTAGYDDYSLSQRFQLIWKIGYNQTRTAQLFEEKSYPVAALCKEPNIRISLVNNKGAILDSWLCQKVGERLTILKPEYYNGDVYLFEASPEYSHTRVWKSKLSVNVASFRHHMINKENPLYHSPTLALLISMYFIVANAF